MATPAGPHPAVRAPRTQVNGNEHLAFVVSVKNSGKFTEVGVVVQLKLKRAGSSKPPIMKTATIASIAPGQTAAR